MRICVALLILIACFEAYGADRCLSRWKTETIDLSGTILSFQYPTACISRDFPPSASIDRLDFGPPSLPPLERPVRVFKKHWDYRGFFWQGVFGTLGMSINVFRKPADFDGDITDLGTLQALLDSVLSADYEAHNRRADPRFRVEMPDEFQLAGANSDWLSYAVGGPIETLGYAHALDPEHYVKISFHFIDNSRGMKTDWRARADTLAKEVMATVTLGDSAFVVANSAGSR